MITPAQLRAARGLLDWTRSELAKASGLSAETIKNIEHGIYTPQENTIAAIVNAFADHDVDFAEDEGVRIRKHRVRVFSGKNGHNAFLDHVYATVKDRGGRICQFNLSDSGNLHYLVEKGQEHFKRMSSVKNLEARVLLPHGDNGTIAPYCEYKLLNTNEHELLPYYIYNDNIAMMMFKDDDFIETVSIHSKLLADSFAKQFDVFWNKAISVETSIQK